MSIWTLTIRLRTYAKHPIFTSRHYDTFAHHWMKTWLCWHVICQVRRPPTSINYSQCKTLSFVLRLLLGEVIVFRQHSTICTGCQFITIYTANRHYLCSRVITLVNLSISTSNWLTTPCKITRILLVMPRTKFACVLYAFNIAEPQLWNILCHSKSLKMQRQLQHLGCV